MKNLKENNNVNYNFEKQILEFNMVPFEYTVKQCMDNFNNMVYEGSPQIDSLIDKTDIEESLMGAYQAGFKDGVECMYEQVREQFPSDYDIIDNIRGDIMYQVVEWGIHEYAYDNIDEENDIEEN